ncbi:MAG: hypothetical protein E7057_03220 [Lentisphaerae bacterium]|nr:hypothetical protein [Lentisphaerota bacterium]
MAENETPRPTRTVSAADYDYLQTLDLKQISRLYYGKFLLRLTSILFWASGIYMCSIGFIWVGLILSLVAAFFLLEGFLLKTAVWAGWIFYGSMILAVSRIYAEGKETFAICTYIAIVLGGIGLWLWAVSWAAGKAIYQYPLWLLRYFRKRKQVERELETFSIDDSCCADKPMILSDEYRHRIAIHEAGHAVCLFFLPEIVPPKLITIDPNHYCFGRVEHGDDPDRIYTETAMKSQVASQYGGCVAERIFFGEMSNGCEHDLTLATNAILNMVRHFGMGKRIGLIASDNYIHSKLEADVNDISREAEKKCTELLTEHQECVAALAELLLEKITLESEEIDKFFSGYEIQSDAEKTSPASGNFPLNNLADAQCTLGEDSDKIELARSKIQQTLEEFAISGRVTGFVSGPRVTRYEITLAPGINVKKVEQIQDNIRMALAATSIRVLAPIPGRSVVGIEVSNSKPEAVFMRSIMESDEWRNSKAEIPLALGKNVSGKPVILDLAKAPHILVAGATGTGKRVCIDTFIMSLLFKFNPDELHLLIFDPSHPNYKTFSKLPHLWTPIINDSAKVPIALRWAANEMDRRYHVLAKVGVKKLSEFNSRPVPAEPEYDDDGNVIPAKMPLLVIILDELADLMMTEAKKDVETNITRIAQKGRAAGIHIIVATQRPSTNIITGVIKANLPTRLCFQVRSLVDSRVVLDTPGAEKLLGMGDMLVMTSSSMEIERVQGAYAAYDEIKSCVKHIIDTNPQVRTNEKLNC